MASPPPYRYDGRSPLPLGMDASRAPSVWKGKHSIWPHDTRGGWSYCIMIPSWTTFLPPKGGNHTDVTPTVFYRVNVGVRSPQGVSSLHFCLRRFSDFMKLHAALKRIFPRKRLPNPPPKNALQRINSDKNAIEERRGILEEWMESLLDDIDVARSSPMAVFLELEKAASEAVIFASDEVVAQVSREEVSTSSGLGNSQFPKIKGTSRGESESSLTSGGFVSESEGEGSLREGSQREEILREGEESLRAREGKGGLREGEDSLRESEGLLREGEGSLREGEESIISGVVRIGELGAEIEMERIMLREKERERDREEQDVLNIGTEWGLERDQSEKNLEKTDIRERQNLTSEGYRGEREGGVGGEATDSAVLLGKGRRGWKESESEREGEGEGEGEKSPREKGIKSSISLKETFISQGVLKRLNLKRNPSESGMSEHGSVLGSDHSLNVWGGRGGSLSPSSSTRGSEGGGGGEVPMFLPRGGGGGPAMKGGEREESVHGDMVNGVSLTLPSSQRATVRKVLNGLQRRLTTAIGDMEEMMARLRQETAVKEFLGSKVKELESELDRERRKGVEAMEAAALAENERVTELKWEVEESRAALCSAEEALERSQALQEEVEEQLRESEASRASLQLELTKVKEREEAALKRREVTESQTKSNTKLLAKEVKTLRSTVSELHEALESSRKERNKLQAQLVGERKEGREQKMERTKVLREVNDLRRRLRECSVEELAREEGRGERDKGREEREDVVELLGTSDARIGLLMAEAQLLAQSERDNFESKKNNSKNLNANGSLMEEDRGWEGGEREREGERAEEGDEEAEGEREGAGEGEGEGEEEEKIESDLVVRRILADILTDNAQLRKSVNSLTRQAVLMASQSQSQSQLESSPVRKSALGRFL